MVYRIVRLGDLLGFRRQMWIEGLQRLKIRPGLQQRECLQQLPAFSRERIDRGQQDVAAPLRQIELSEVKRAPVTGSLPPAVEIAGVGRIVVDQPSQRADHERVAITVGLEIRLDGSRIPGDAAGPDRASGLPR